jgi:hypothetical protein
MKNGLCKRACRVLMAGMLYGTLMMPVSVNAQDQIQPAAQSEQGAAQDQSQPQAFLLTQPNPSSQVAQDLYVNETGQTVNVMLTAVAPGAQTQFVQQLQPGQYYTWQRVYGASVSFQLANGQGQIEQRTKQGVQGQYIALVLVGAVPPVPPAPQPQGTTYINRTGETVHQYEQAPPSIPPSPSRYIRSLQPNEMWTDGPTRVSPLQWQPASGYGQIQQVVETLATGQQVTALVKTEGNNPNPAPGQSGITYINRTGEAVNVFEQQGVTYPPSQPTFLQQLQPNQSFNRMGPQVSPLVFRLASGAGQIQEVQESPQPGNPSRIIGLTKTNTSPGPSPNGNIMTYINKTGQPVFVYSQMNGNPQYPQQAQYETTIQIGGSYQHTVMPGSPTKSFRLQNGGNILQRSTSDPNQIELVTTGLPTPGIPGEWGPWQPVPGSGEWGPWQPVPGSGEWGPWQPVPGSGGWGPWTPVPGGFRPGG